jgi:hypothetical protein
VEIGTHASADWSTRYFPSGQRSILSFHEIPLPDAALHFAPVYAVHGYEIATPLCDVASDHHCKPDLVELPIALEAFGCFEGMVRVLPSTDQLSKSFQIYMIDWMISQGFL